jgi:hypothetical protein
MHQEAVSPLGKAFRPGDSRTSLVGQKRKSGVAARMSALRVKADEFSGKADIVL